MEVKKPNEFVLEFALAQTGGLKDIGFMVFQARVHYLIPHKKLALGTIMVKNGSENKITTQNFGMS